MKEVRNANVPITSAIAFLEMTTNAPLGGFDIGIIAVVQDHQLNITEDILDRIIIGTAFGQGNPMQLQLAHQATRLTGLARMCGIAIERNPHRLLGVPVANLLHETAQIIGAFVIVKGPTAATGIDFIGDKQIEQPSCFLPALQDQAFGRSIAPAPVGFDGNGLFIEEQQHTFGR
jgi:hypothetical protein